VRFVEPGGGEPGGVSPQSLAAAALGIPWIAGAAGDREDPGPATLLAGALRALARRAAARLAPPLLF
jgi:hypothetical protein